MNQCIIGFIGYLTHTGHLWTRISYQSVETAISSRGYGIFHVHTRVFPHLILCGLSNADMRAYNKVDKVKDIRVPEVHTDRHLA